MKALNSPLFIASQLGLRGIISCFASSAGSERNHFGTILGPLVIVLLVLFSACRENPKCWGENKINGIVIDNNISEEFFCGPSLSGSEYVIDNQAMMDSVFSNDCNTPELDFNIETLLGQYADGSCELKYIREVTKIDSEKRYHYKVTVKECGICKKLAFSYNWVTVPKLPPGWTVTFEMKKK